MIKRTNGSNCQPDGYISYQICNRQGGITKDPITWADNGMLGVLIDLLQVD